MLNRLIIMINKLINKFLFIFRIIFLNNNYNFNYYKIFWCQNQRSLQRSLQRRTQLWMQLPKQILRSQQLLPQQLLHRFKEILQLLNHHQKAPTFHLLLKMNMKKDLAVDLIKEDQQISWDTMKNNHLILHFKNQH